MSRKRMVPVIVSKKEFIPNAVWVVLEQGEK
jgi:hypothetical protein